MTKTGKRFDGLATAKFGVEIGSIVTAEFTEASGLEMELDIYEYEEGGNNLFTHKLPGRMKFPNVVLKSGVTDNNDLWEWFVKGASGRIEPQNISIILYDQTNTEVRRWNLTEAYPIKWTGPSFKAGENAIAVEKIEFAHKGVVPQ
ncbi:MAG: phage tail protein [Dehalococcoidia bacterium]